MHVIHRFQKIRHETQCNNTRLCMFAIYSITIVSCAKKLAKKVEKCYNMLAAVFQRINIPIKERRFKPKKDNRCRLWQIIFHKRRKI